jgi:hypothetical protein
MQQLVKNITVFLIFATLCAPVLLHRAGKQLGEPVTENRVLTNFPDSCEDVTSCVENVTNWFNDHYAPRNLLIRLQTQMQYSFFGVSDKVHIGPDGWLYYRDVLDAQKTNLERLPTHVEEAFYDEILRLNRLLKAESIELIVLPLPLKDTLYPEFVPDTAPTLPTPSRYQKFSRWLSDNQITTIDAAKILNSVKKERAVFFKTDFHWTDPAAFTVAEKLVNTLANKEGKTGWRNGFKTESREFSGGQANFLPLLNKPKEDALFLIDTWTATSAGKYKYRADAGYWEYIFINPSTADYLGPIVVFGDSFYDGLLRSGIDQHFQSVHRARINVTTLPEVLTNIPCDTKYFLFETIESSLFGWMAAGLSVPETLPPCVQSKMNY